MTNLICIVCPKGCHLTVDENNDYAVSGYSCARGLAYGKEELKNPTRVVTSTVKIKDGLHPRCPVKTNGSIPQKLVWDAVNLLKGVELKAPVHTGDVVVKDICGTGVNFIVTKNIYPIDFTNR